MEGTSLDYLKTSVLNEPLTHLVEEQSLTHPTKSQLRADYYHRSVEWVPRSVWVTRGAMAILARVAPDLPLALRQSPLAG